MFATHFLYLLLHRDLKAAEAFEQARCDLDGRRLFRLFTSRMNHSV